MKSLMKLTSLLLVETLSPSDYIMVNVANTNCTDSIKPANSSQRHLLEECIDAKLDNISVGINPKAVCQEFYRYSILASIFQLLKCIYLIRLTGGALGLPISNHAKLIILLTDQTINYKNLSECTNISRNTSISIIMNHASGS